MFGFRQLFAFLAPYDCIVCGCEGYILCPICLPGLVEPVQDLPYIEGINQLWAAGSYQGFIRQLVGFYKFQRAGDVSLALAELLNRTAPPFAPTTLVTYIPTAAMRVRQRGYDQAHDLARAFAQSRSLAFAPLLRRSGKSRQVGAGRQKRRQQLRHAYHSRDPKRIMGAQILVIDDVLTTGASMEVVAKILRQAGCLAVDGLVVAYKV